MARMQSHMYRNSYRDRWLQTTISGNVQIPTETIRGCRHRRTERRRAQGDSDLRRRSDTGGQSEDGCRGTATFGDGQTQAGADTDGQSEDGRRGTATYGDGQTQTDRVKTGAGEQRPTETVRHRRTEQGTDTDGRRSTVTYGDSQTQAGRCRRRRHPIVTRVLGCNR